MPSNELYWAQNFDYLDDHEKKIALDHFRAPGESDEEVLLAIRRIASGAAAEETTLITPVSKPSHSKLETRGSDPEGTT